MESVNKKVVNIIVAIIICMVIMTIMNYSNHLKIVNAAWSNTQTIRSGFRVDSYFYNNLSSSLGQVTKYVGMLTPKKKMKLLSGYVQYSGLPASGITNWNISHMGEVLNPDTTYHIYISYVHTIDPNDDYTKYYRCCNTSGRQQDFENADFKFISTTDSIEYTIGYQMFYNNLPSVSVATPTQSQCFSEQDIAFAPSISVSDTNNDTLTCKCYFDYDTIAKDTKTVSNTATAQTVTFSQLNMSTLPQGIHMLRFEISDGYDTVNKSVVIRVDKSAPRLNKVNVTSTSTSITIKASATDNISGLDTNAYRYTIGSYVSAWTAQNTYTQSSLVSNTPYLIKIEVKDAKGHINSSFQKTYRTAN